MRNTEIVPVVRKPAVGEYRVCLPLGVKESVRDVIREVTEVSMNDLVGREVCRNFEVSIQLVGNLNLHGSIHITSSVNFGKVFPFQSLQGRYKCLESQIDDCRVGQRLAGTVCNLRPAARKFQPEPYDYGLYSNVCSGNGISLLLYWSGRHAAASKKPAGHDHRFAGH